MQDQACVSCGLGCSTCNANGTCTSCQSGFSLLSIGVCEQCIDGCSTCAKDALNVCASGCQSGTYQSNSSCLPCTAPCITCSAADICTSCITGYELINGTCNKWCDDSNCYDCSYRSSICQECFAGYKLSNNSCVGDLSCNAKFTNQNSTNNTN